MHKVTYELLKDLVLFVRKSLHFTFVNYRIERPHYNRTSVRIYAFFSVKKSPFLEWVLLTDRKSSNDHISIYQSTLGIRITHKVLTLV